jgi:uncharacterized protein involved in exopolysaccharide biosynthesis
MKEEQGITLRDLLNIIYRRIWVLKLVVCLLPLGVLVACLLVTPSFESNAKVVITAKKETASLLAGTTPGPSQIINLNVDEMDLNTEMEILRSVDLWTKTVEALGPEFLRGSGPGPLSRMLPALENTVGELLGTAAPSEKAAQKDHTDRIRSAAVGLISSFTAIPAPKSRVIDLSMKSSTADRAQKILSVLLDQYIPYHILVYSLPGVEVFFADQVKEAKEVYERANRELTEFRKRWNLPLPDRQKTELISTMKSLEDSLLEANSSVDQYHTMLERMKKGGMVTGQLIPSLQRGNEITLINVMAVQLLQAEQKQLQVGEVFTAESRDFRAATEQLNEITGKFHDVLEGELSILKTKKASIEQNRDTVLGQMRVLLEKSEEARTLQLEEQITKEQYLQFVAKSEAAKIDNLESRKKLVDVKILGRPSVPASAVFPRTGLFVLAAFIFSFPLAIGIIFMASFFDYTYDGPQQLEKATGFSVLATLGKLTKGKPPKS